MPRRRFTITAAISFALAILFLGTYFVRQCALIIRDRTSSPIAAVGIFEGEAAIAHTSFFHWPNHLDWEFHGYRLPEHRRLLHFRTASSLPLPNGDVATMYFFPI